MALNLQTTYTSPTDLLNQIATFLKNVAGWSELMAPTLVTGVGYRAHYSRTIVKNGKSNTLYWHLFAMTANVAAPGVAVNVGIHGYVSTGFDGSLAWNLQPGANTSSTGSNLISYLMKTQLAPTTPQFAAFYSNSYGDVLLTAQYQSSHTFKSHLMAGVLDSNGYGSYVGGMFYSGSINSRLAGGRVGGNSTDLIEVQWGMAIGCFAGTAYPTNNLEVYLTVDGSSKWHSIGLRSDYLYSSYCSANYGQSSTAYYNILQYDNMRKIALPCLTRYSVGVTVPTGKISSYPIEITIYRPTYARYSPIGVLPLIRACYAITNENEIPVGTIIQQSNIQYYLDTFAAIEMN